MSKSIDLTGKRFGRLNVISHKCKQNGHNYYVCICDCGNEKTIRGDNLRNGSTKSCGCLKHEVLIKKNREYMKIDKMREDMSLYKGTNIDKLTQKKHKNNTTGFAGVSYNKARNEYQSYINLKGKRHHLGWFKNKLDAVKARKIAEEELFYPIIEEYKNEVIK